MTPSRSRLHLAVLAAALLSPAATAAAQPSAPTPGEPAEACSLRTLSSEPLRVEDGSLLYVEPYVMETNVAGDALLAGRFAYRSDYEAADARWRVTEKGRALGAFVPRSGSARAIPPPVPLHRMDAIRASARADGGWDVTFAELPEWNQEAGLPRPDTALRLWHGVLHGARWERLDPVPLPPVGVDPRQASELVRHGDTLSLAFAYARAHAVPAIVVFHRSGGSWSHEFVPVRFPLSLTLAHSDRLGLVLAAVASDHLGDGGPSLLLWAKERGSWRQVSNVVPGARGHPHNPALSLEGGALTWSIVPQDVPPGVPGRLETVVGRIEEGEPVLAVDSTAALMVRVTPLHAAARRVWLFPRTAAGENPMVALHAVGEGTLGLEPLPTDIAPFAAGFRASPLPGGEILVAGGQIPPGNQYLYSRLDRIRLHCTTETDSPATREPLTWEEP